MKYMVILQLYLTALFAHGKEYEHLHFFSSLHIEYFLFFVVGLVGAYFIYSRFFRDNQ